MREIVETGTDVAAIAIGDPSLLVALRACKGKGFHEELSKAVASGALWRSETGADGAYLVHLFIDEEPPASIAGFMHAPITVDRFRVPSGRVLVAGEECFVGAISPNAYPQMGREVSVPPGDYTFTAYLAEPPDDRLERRFDEQATAPQRYAWSRAGTLPPICVLATIAAVAVGYLIYLRTLSVWLALAPLLVALAAWIWQARVRRGTDYRSAEQVFRMIERELPSIFVVMRRKA